MPREIWLISRSQNTVYQKTVFSRLHCKYSAETLSENVAVVIQDVQQNITAENIAYNIWEILINIFSC